MSTRRLSLVPLLAMTLYAQTDADRCSALGRASIPAFRVTHAAIGSAWETQAFLSIAPERRRRPSDPEPRVFGRRS